MVPAFSEDELAACYAQHEVALFSVIRRRVWDDDEAREIVQSTFVRLWGMGAAIDRARVKSLLFKIALNLASNHLRRQRRWGWLRRHRDDDAELAAVPSPRDSPEEALGKKAREATLRHALDSLSPELRDVVLLTELSDLSYKEVGAALGIPEGTVGSRRHQALKRLRLVLQEAS